LNTFKLNTIEIMVTRKEVMASWENPACLLRCCFHDGTEVLITAYNKAKENLKALKEGRKYVLEVAVVGRP